MASDLAASLRKLTPGSGDYAIEFVVLMLAAARRRGATDLHLQPMADGLNLRWRIDGVLQSIGTFSRGTAADVVTRLKVLAQLLTYRTDLPQEGRITGTTGEGDLRVCTCPTVFGERAVVRFFAAENRYLFPEYLGLPDAIAADFVTWLEETSGLVIVAGPAGSGKTTTAYAGLRHIARAAADARSLVSLEDPVEVIVPGVAQAQINPAAGFALSDGLKSLMRQDPEVILVGEMRDAPTAEAAFQAALTGHLIVSTFHAGGAAEAIGRLLDMGLEPYVVRSGLRGVLSQRLLRRLCACGIASDDLAARCGLDVNRFRVPVGCDACGGSGYRGRVLAAERLPPLEGDLARDVLLRHDVRRMEASAQAAGMVTLAEQALARVAAGEIAPLEFRRIFGRLRASGPIGR